MPLVHRTGIIGLIFAAGMAIIPEMPDSLGFSAIRDLGWHRRNDLGALPAD
jgi:hypothetical protein